MPDYTYEGEEMLVGYNKTSFKTQLEILEITISWWGETNDCIICLYFGSGNSFKGHEVTSGGKLPTSRQMFKILLMGRMFYG